MAILFHYSNLSLSSKIGSNNEIILDPDGYLISLFEPIFEDKDQQIGGYQGFTPA